MPNEFCIYLVSKHHKFNGNEMFHTNMYSRHKCVLFTENSKIALISLSYTWTLLFNVHLFVRHSVPSYCTVNEYEETILTGAAPAKHDLEQAVVRGCMVPLRH